LAFLISIQDGVGFGWFFYWLLNIFAFFLQVLRKMIKGGQASYPFSWYYSIALLYSSIWYSLLFWLKKYTHHLPLNYFISVIYVISCLIFSFSIFVLRMRRWQQIQRGHIYGLRIHGPWFNRSCWPAWHEIYCPPD
jgi:hypothetical protein